MLRVVDDVRIEQLEEQGFECIDAYETYEVTVCGTHISFSNIKKNLGIWFTTTNETAFEPENAKKISEFLSHLIELGLVEKVEK